MGRDSKGVNMKKTLPFLLFLVIPVLCFGQPEGFSKVEDPENDTVLFKDRVKLTLSTVYSNVTKEIPFCLHGYVRGDSVMVTDLSVPVIKSMTDTSGINTRKVCRARGGYLGVVHNHGTGGCAPSDADKWRFVLDEYAVIETIACNRGVEKFYVFMKKND